jgi:hypothetical protein
MSTWILPFACASALLAGCGRDKPAAAEHEAQIDPVLGTPSLPAPTDPKAAALLEEAYALKQYGRNGPALAAIEKACGIIERTAGAASAEYGSCLDDEASVHLRMGRTDVARSLYHRSLGVLGKAKEADSRLVDGVKMRLNDLELMVHKGIACAETAEPPPPDAGVTVPYFPDVEEMQNAIGELNPYVSECSDGVPEAVTVRVIVTGDGRAVRAETRGLHEGDPLGKCVLEKLLAAFPKAKLPPFRACFRSFTYPFMVGRHESRQEP